ncbi:hypothetical protein V493_03686 [Pseudogymnoascus sp. VKM F-4281 (FW-2241)]|nr:hypothetical protein V493_03686 [Pseudogymnoascus sp. VKM F-4281 (FW-2241)]
MNAMTIPEPAQKQSADAIRPKVTDDKSHHGGTPFPRAKSKTAPTTPSIRRVAQPPAHTTTAEPSRRLNDGSRIVAFGTPSKQRSDTPAAPSAASLAPPSVHACAAQTLVGVTLIDQGPRSSGGVHALAWDPVLRL